MKHTVLGGSFVVLLATLACGGGADPSPANELQRVRVGDLEVVLLSLNQALRQGKDTFVIEFRSASEPDARLVDVGDLKATATMPMPGAGPMLGPVDVRRTQAAGRYTAASDFSMAGTWRLALEWNGARGRGAASLSIAAQ